MCWLQNQTEIPKYNYIYTICIGLSYYDKVTGASIWRSSQTMVGFLTNRSLEDERMLTEIARTNPYNPNSLIIYDARSLLNATFNRLNRGGYENTKDYYTNC